MLPVPKVPKGAIPQKYKLNERILKELCIVKLNCCLVFSSATGQSNRESVEGAEKLVLIAKEMKHFPDIIRNE